MGMILTTYGGIWKLVDSKPFETIFRLYSEACVGWELCNSLVNPSPVPIYSAGDQGLLGNPSHGHPERRSFPLSHILPPPCLYRGASRRLPQYFWFLSAPEWTPDGGRPWNV